MTRSKVSTATELPGNDNYEELPALPANMDRWLSDSVSPIRENKAYGAAATYVLSLMLEWGEDGSNTFETYAPYLAGFLDGWSARDKMNAAPRQGSTVEDHHVCTQVEPAVTPPDEPWKRYIRPRINSSLLPDD